MAGIIEVAPRKEGAGLGAKDSSLSAPTSRSKFYRQSLSLSTFKLIICLIYAEETYKDAVRRTALQRFKEMSEG